MTVEELIARLRELPRDAIVLVRNQDGELAQVDDADVMHMVGVTERVYIAGSY